MTNDDHHGAISQSKIDILELLSTCVSLSESACAIIRDVQHNREQGLTIGTTMKDPSDSRSYLTVADQRAQQVIVDALLGEWPDLPIVAEEDERDEGWVVPECYRTPPRKDRFATSSIEVPDDLRDISINEVCVFIDPVDGTREFVEGRLLSCQCLIGIAVRGRSVAGVIGLPFHDRCNSNSGREYGRLVDPPSSASGLLIYALGQSVYGLDSMLESVDKVDKEETRVEQLTSATSAKTTDPALLHAQSTIDSLTPSSHQVIAGGCGNKILTLLTNGADVTLFNLGTSLWDTCATEAVLNATGGCLTDLFGRPIYHGFRAQRENRFGVVATSAQFESVSGVAHGELCRRIGRGVEVMGLLQRWCGYCLDSDADGDGEQEFREQAVDICRTVDGRVFTAAYLGEKVFGDGSAVEGWTAPEEGAVRYKQSHACRIHLRKTKDNEKDREVVANGSDAVGGTGNAATSVFCKRIVLRELPYALKKATTAPFKLARDVRANGVEAAFLRSTALKAFVRAEAEAAENSRGKGGRGSTQIPPSHSTAGKGYSLPVAVQRIAAKAGRKEKMDGVDDATDNDGINIHVLSKVGLPYNTEAISYPSNPIDSRFVLLLFDFHPSLGWEPTPLLQSRLQLYATLQSLARFHAFFWIGKDATADGVACSDNNTEEGRYWGPRLAKDGTVWDTGGYWDLAKLRPGILDEIQPKWARIVEEFRTVFREDASYLAMDEDEVGSLGKRLHAMAPGVCRRTHGQLIDGTKVAGLVDAGTTHNNGDDGCCYTVLHGDAKAANFFYNRTGLDGDGRAGSSEGSSIGVGMIDFQWTGVGMPATDIAYCLAASASGLVLDRDMEPCDDDDGEGGTPHRDSCCDRGVGELQCLRYYHTCLMEALVEYGVVGTADEGGSLLPYETFRRQFQEAVVDLFRTVVTDWWSSMTPALLEEREGAMAYNACNKSMHTALWLIKYTAACMRRLEAAGKMPI